MKKNISILFACLLLGSGTFQAEAQQKKWSLEECIQYAIDHNIELKQLFLEQESREIILETSKYSWIPNLSAGVGSDFSFGRSLSSENTYIDRNAYSASGSLSTSMTLFDLSIPSDIAARKLDLLASIESLNKARESLAMNVTSYFLQVLYTKEILKIAELQVELTAEQVGRTETLVTNGKVPLSQLYDIQAQLANDEVTLSEARNNVKLALLDLAQSLELERDGGEFDINTPETEDVIEEHMGSIIPPDNIYDFAVTFKPQIKEQEYLLESQKKTLKIAQAAHLPTINLNAGIGSNYYYLYNNPIVEAPDGTIRGGNDNFSDQLRANERKYVGVSMSIPIFNRFRVRNNVRTARVNILNRELIMDNTKKALYKEIQQAYYTAIASQEKLIASEKSVFASEKAFNYAEERYNAGKSTVFEFNEAKTKLAQSLSEQAQAKYNFIFRAKILDFYNGIPIKL